MVEGQIFNERRLELIGLSSDVGAGEAAVKKMHGNHGLRSVAECAGQPEVIRDVETRVFRLTRRQEPPPNRSLNARSQTLARKHPVPVEGDRPHVPGDLDPARLE